MSTPTTAAPQIDAARFRHVLGHLPTGVAVITARDPDPVGLAVGTFTSVSLDPPMVGFLVDRDSTSWPAVERCGAFAANVLAEDQAALAAQFGRRGVDRFSGVAITPGRHGLPLIAGAVATVECTIAGIVDAGDHRFVLGRVLDLGAREAANPLTFFRGAFHRLAHAA